MALREPEFTWDQTRPLIEVKHLVKEFTSAAGSAQVLKNINLEFQGGEFTSVIGRSGSGKSTLVNMLSGIDHPTSGEVIIGGTSLHHMDEGAMARWRGRMLGIVFQFFQLLPTLTLLENVLLPMDFCRRYEPAEREKRARYLLDLVGLSAFADKLPAAVAGGQQQCAAVARALANDAPIILADEPTGNLDSASAESVMRLFDDLASQGKTILMVTHDRELARRAKRTILISDGEVVSDAIAWAFPGLPDEVLLQLTRKATAERVTAGSPLQSPSGESPQDILLVKMGALEVRCAGDHADRLEGNLRVSTGQWVDLRWLMSRGPVTVQAWDEGDVEVVHIRGEDFDGLTTGYDVGSVAPRFSGSRRE